MVGEERPRIDKPCLRFGKPGQAPDKVFPDGVVPEDLPPFYRPCHDMLQHARGVKPCVSEHAVILAYVVFVGNVP